MQVLRNTIYLGILMSLFAASAWGSDEQRSHSTESVQEMFVTATMTEKEIEKAPGSLEVITFKAIEEMGADTVSQALEEATGLVIETESGRVKTPNIRGTGVKHTLILIDGRRLAAGFRELVDLNHIPVEMVDRIEVIRGAGSALYGSDAMGGVVNIITKKPTEELSAGLSYKFGLDAYGAAESNRYAAYAGNSAGKLGFFVSGSLDSRNGYDHDGTSPDDGDDLAFGSAQGRFIYNLTEAQALSAGFEYSNDDREGIRDFQAQDRLRDSEDKRQNYYLQYDDKTGSDRTFMFRVAHSDYENSIEMTPAPAEPSSSIEHKLNEATGKFSGVYFKQHAITSGFDFREEARTEVNLRSDDVDNLGFYLQDEFQITDPLYIVFGLRYDDHSEFGSNWAPRTSVVFSAFDNLRLKASWGTGFRAPTLSELFSTSYKKRGKEIYEPNADLVAEESESYDIGIEGEYGTFFGKFGLFEHKFDNLIDAVHYKSKGSGKKKVDYYKYENISEATTRGVEGNIGIRLPAGFSLSGNLTYVDDKDRDITEYLKSQVKVSQAYPQFGLHWNIRANYKGKMKETNGDSLDNYATYHCYLSKELSNSIKIHAGADNIFNEKSDDHMITPATYYCGVSFEL